MHTRVKHLELYALGELPEEQSGTIESHLKEFVRNRERASANGRLLRRRITAGKSAEARA
jgi:hypothetical protein